MAVDETRVNFSTGYNYQKIAFQGSGSISVPNDPINFTDVTITHNLGYVPSARAWYDPELGKRFPLSLEQFIDDTSGTSEVDTTVAEAYLTTTTLVLRFRNASGSPVNVTYWYRIYYDT